MPVFAQRFEITPFAGWASDIEPDDDPFPFSAFALSLILDEESSYGFTGSYSLSERWLLEAGYSRQPRKARVEFDETGETFFDADMDLDLIEIGGQRQWKGEVFRPFVGLNLGRANIDSDAFINGTDDAWTASIAAGFRAIWHERIGLRLDARYQTLFLDLDSDGALCSFFSCSNNPPSTEVSYFEIRGGLIIGFGGQSR